MRGSQSPSGMLSPECQRSRHSKEDDVDEWACGNAPEGGCWTWRRVYVCNAAERPQHDPICCAAYLTARKRMSELMKRDNEEQCQIFRYVPSDGRITASSHTDFECRHKKPRPVQKYINSCQMKQSDRSFCTLHYARVIAWGGSASS